MRQGIVYVTLRPDEATGSHHYRQASTEADDMGATIVGVERVTCIPGLFSDLDLPDVDALVFLVEESIAGP